MHRLHLLRDLLDDAHARLEGMQRGWRQFDAILEMLPATIFVCEAAPPNRGIYVSPSVERVFGWAPDQLLAEVWWRHVHPDDVERVRASIAAMVQERSAEVEYRFAHPRLGWRRVRTLARLAIDPESGARLVPGVSWDVTALAAPLPMPAPGAAGRAEFLAMLAHEIRNPLNAMAGALDVLGAITTDPAARPWLDVLGRGLAAALALTGDTLDCGLLDAGQMRIEVGPLDVAAVLRDVEMLCRLAAERAGLALTVRVMPGMPHDLHGDPHRLRQILVNLVQNAVRFTPEGSVTVEAAIGEVAPDRAILVLAVTDTGPGLDAARRQRLFQPFAQPPGQPAHGARGTGLGLTITQRLVAAMGGAVTVEAPDAGGCRFVVRVPVRRASSPA